MYNSHHMERLPALPLVAEYKVDDYKKAKEVMLLLTKLKAWDDIKKICLDLSKSSSNSRKQSLCGSAQETLHHL